MSSSKRGLVAPPKVPPKAASNPIPPNQTVQAPPGLETQFIASVDRSLMDTRPLSTQAWREIHMHDDLTDTQINQQLSPIKSFSPLTQAVLRKWDPAPLASGQPQTQFKLGSRGSPFTLLSNSALNSQALGMAIFPSQSMPNPTPPPNSLYQTPTRASLAKAGERAGKTPSLKPPGFDFRISPEQIPRKKRQVDFDSALDDTYRQIPRGPRSPKRRHHLDVGALSSPSPDPRNQRAGNLFSFNDMDHFNTPPSNQEAARKLRTQREEIPRSSRIQSEPASSESQVESGISSLPSSSLILAAAQVQASIPSSTTAPNADPHVFRFSGPPPGLTVEMAESWWFLVRQIKRDWLIDFSKFEPPATWFCSEQEPKHISIEVLQELRVIASLHGHAETAVLQELFVIARYRHTEPGQIKQNFITVSDMRLFIDNIVMDAFRVWPRAPPGSHDYANGPRFVPALYRPPELHERE